MLASLILCCHVGRPRTMADSRTCRLLVLGVTWARLLVSWRRCLSHSASVILVPHLLGGFCLPLSQRRLLAGPLARTQPNVCSQTRWAAGIMILAFASSTWVVFNHCLVPQNWVAVFAVATWWCHSHHGSTQQTPGVYLELKLHLVQAHAVVKTSPDQPSAPPNNPGSNRQSDDGS